jgi:RNA polymerase sigma-B factor
MTTIPLGRLDATARRRWEDARLIRRHRQGVPRAREALIERYIPLARALAHRYGGRGEPIEDLVQVACVGLVKAVDRWDPERGFTFSTFAVPTVLGELRRHFRDHTWDVRPPRRLQELSLAVEAARDELSGQTGREPTLVNLADRLGLSCDDIDEALQASGARHARSIDLPVHEDDDASDATLGDAIGSHDEAYARFETSASLGQLTATLDHRAREVLRLRFEEDLYQSEIARRVGCTQMHVSRIIRASLEKLAAGAVTDLAA